MHEDGVHQIQAGWQRIRVRRAGGLQRQRRLKPGSWCGCPSRGVAKRCCGWWCALPRPQRRRKVEDDRLLRAADCADCKQKKPAAPHTRAVSSTWQKKAKAEKRTMLGGRPIDLAWEAEKAAWIEDDLDIEPYLAKGYNTDEGLPKLTELRLGMRMGFDEAATMTRPYRCVSSRSAVCISCGIGPESRACCRPCTTRTLFTASKKTSCGNC